MAISEEEKARRRMAWEDICGSFALEGLYPSERDHELAELYIEGRLTSDEWHRIVKRELGIDGG